MNRVYAILTRTLRASLVTISSCTSGGGRTMDGDELMGFSRYFLRRGVSSLLVSLWPVDDEITSRFMIDVYRRLSRGERPHKALQAAQLTCRRMHSAPFHWAPFILIGGTAPV